jgi:uncharacterized membrane protein YjgN (DUF898 family)
LDATNPSQPRPLLNYDGRIGELYKLFLVNLLLSIVTFGFFRFWAITRYRRYLWSHMRFMETRFEYTGLGSELLLGLFMAIAILMGLAVATGVLTFLFALVSPALAIVPIIGMYIGLFILFGAAHFSAQRYRLSRTLWRGIRFGMQGSALAYGAWNLLYLILIPLTLYQLIPWTTIRLAERRINASRFGNLAFNFKGRAGAVYVPFLLTLIATIILGAIIAAVVYNMEAATLGPVFSGRVSGTRAEMMINRAMPMIIAGVLVFSFGAGLIGCWYYAVLSRHILGNTTCADMRFSSQVTAGSLLWILLSNALISLFTIGLGYPIVLHRSMRYLANNVRVSGTLAPEALHQSTLPPPRTGEGMLQALDSGGGIL